MNFRAGQVLGSDGRDGEYIYLIAQGQVDVLRSARSSAELESAEADEDDLDSDAMPCKIANKKCCCMCRHNVVHAVCVHVILKGHCCLVSTFVTRCLLHALQLPTGCLALHFVAL